MNYNSAVSSRERLSTASSGRWRELQVGVSQASCFDARCFDGARTRIGETSAADGADMCWLKAATQTIRSTVLDNFFLPLAAALRHPVSVNSETRITMAETADPDRNVATLEADVR